MYLVVFRNRKRADVDRFAYETDAIAMHELAVARPGFLSFKSYVAEDGETVAISEWESREAALDWRRMAEHLEVQAKGREQYYESYTVFGCDEPHVRHFEAAE
jgi:heme-degrading monooxygenase HmoA